MSGGHMFFKKKVPHPNWKNMTTWSVYRSMVGQIIPPPLTKGYAAWLVRALNQQDKREPLPRAKKRYLKDHVKWVSVDKKGRRC